MEYTEDINEWQQIEHPSPETSPTVHQSSVGWNMAMINENYLQLQNDQSSSILPLTHQQASLQIVPTTEPEDGTSTPSAASSIVSDEEGESPLTAAPPSEWRVRVANEGRKLLKLRLEAMRAGVVRVVSKVRNCAICAGAFWSFSYVTGAAAAVLVSLAYVGIRRRRGRVGRQSLDHLVYLLREKDEKISQLLLQISQLNEVLSSRRKVPVLRISSS